MSGLAGVKPEELQLLQQPAVGAPSPGGARRGPGSPAGTPALAGGRGGAYFPLRSPTLEELNDAVTGLDGLSDLHADVFTLIESRLFEERMRGLMVPSATPVDGPVGSGFGFRSDPITGRTALHTGLDFPAEPGTPIRAAAGGVVLELGAHPEYGQTLELDHGNMLTTLYAHLRRALVKPGDIVRRGQVIAEVGNTGRSTGPHLHFEVLLQGVPQNPARFLAVQPAPWEAAARGALRGDSRGGPVVK